MLVFFRCHNRVEYLVYGTNPLVFPCMRALCYPPSTTRKHRLLASPSLLCYDGQVQQARPSDLSPTAFPRILDLLTLGLITIYR